MKKYEHKISPRPGIEATPIYVGGRDNLGQSGKVIKLSANENPYGPSPKAVKAFVSAKNRLALYPDSSHYELRSAIADVNTIRTDDIVCGAGSDELIHLLCQCYAGLGDEVIHTKHGFAMYKISALAVGATPIEVRENERQTNVDAILQACSSKTKLIFVANPNNPTGTMIGSDQIKKLVENVPLQAIVVLDGAYAEYLNDFDSGIEFVEKRSNVFVLRTFSKIYGLGSLRVGWGYGPNHIIRNLLRVKGPFNLSTAAQRAATAAITDTAYVQSCRSENQHWREWLTHEVRSIGFLSDDSFGNFILLRLKNVETALTVNEYLNKAGIIIRNVDNYGLPNCLRISIGTAKQCKKVVGVLKLFKKENP